MHWKTFGRLTAEHAALAQVSFHDIARKLGFLHRLLGRVNQFRKIALPSRKQ